MLPESWQAVQRLLCLRLDNIGDVVLLSPALRALKRALPQATLTLMASPAGSQVVPLLPWVDQVWVERTLWQDASGQFPFQPEREQALIHKLRQQNFDAAIVFTSFSQSPYPPAYVCYLAGIPLRAGQSKEFGGSVLSHWIKPLPDPIHQAERNLHLLESLGLEVHDRQLELQIPELVQAQTRRLLQNQGIPPHEPFLLLAPGASCSARRYPPERYAEVARLLQAECPIVVVGSEKERTLLQPILDVPGVISLVGLTTIPQLAAVIQQASLVIANDSGPMHFADALQRPIVVLYSGTELEQQWRPRNTQTHLLRCPTSCSPCYQFQCPYHLECLDIAPDEVVAAVQQLLQADARSQIISERLVHELSI